MNNPNPRRSLFLAAAGGLVGFFIVLLSRTIAIIIAVTSTNFIFDGSSFSVWAGLILFGFVPLLIILGAGIPAWVLSANLRRGLLAGVVATGVFGFLAVGRVSISPFNKGETLAFVGTVFTAALIATIKSDRSQLRRLMMMLVLAASLVYLTYALPEENYTVGFVISLLAWIFLPLTATFFAMPETNK